MYSSVSKKPETRTEGLGNENNTAVLTDGTHFGRIDAIKATDSVSIEDEKTRLYMTV